MEHTAFCAEEYDEKYDRHFHFMKSFMNRLSMCWTYQEKCLLLQKGLKMLGRHFQPFFVECFFHLEGNCLRK